MIKQINRKFRFTIISFTVYFLGISGILLYAYVVTDAANDNTNAGHIITAIGFVFLLATVFVAAYMSNRLNYLMNLSYIYKIHDAQGQPLKIKHTKDVQTLYNYLKNKEYKLFKSDENHYVFYRVSNDTIKKIFSMYMLEVVVYVIHKQSDFYLDIVNDEINEIKDVLLKQKKKINRLFVTQIKEIDELDEKTKEALAEIVFLRTKYHIISTINIGLLNQELAVLAYSDTYAPSLYYSYHVEQIKKFI